MLVLYSSTITMMHGPINISELCVYSTGTHKLIPSLVVSIEFLGHNKITKSDSNASPCLDGNL